MTKHAYVITEYEEGVPSTEVAELTVRTTDLTDPVEISILDGQVIETSITLTPVQVRGLRDHLNLICVNHG